MKELRYDGTMDGRKEGRNGIESADLFIVFSVPGKILIHVGNVEREREGERTNCKKEGCSV